MISSVVDEVHNGPSSPTRSSLEANTSLDEEGVGSGESEEGRGMTDGEDMGDGEEDQLYVDERLLQKDFIVDKYTLAVHFYSKVCV